MTGLVMNVRCGQCGTVYRVDPAKVPEDGIRARCARCSAMIDVRSPESEAPRGEDVASIAPPPFGAGNAEQRARTLARALASDITVYQRDRWERALREGTLRQEFGGEIRKSWAEYVGQVGNQIARETSYFQDALNEILARGARLF